MVSHCQRGSVQSSRPDVKKRVAFIGQPNTGKSTFFNRITKANAAIANWPGLTVDLFRAVVPLQGELIEFVDLPGIYDLNGFSEDERVVQRFLANYAVNLVVVVVNAAQIDRQIRLLLQVQTLGIPAITLLNLADEAKRYGVQIDVAALQERLGLPLYPISAKYGTGCSRAMDAIGRAVKDQPEAYQIPNLVNVLSDHPVAIADMETALAGVVQMPSPNARTLTNVIDGVMLHPVLAYPSFSLLCLGYFG